ncbi:MAG: flavin monoamine oxidase family protein [Sandaracinaceae bacterium]
MPKELDVLIVGAGLAGLHLASRLHDRAELRVFDARERVGGRVLSVEVGGAAFDLGPAWFWEGQPRMAALVRELELASFLQYSQGDGTFEDSAGRVMRGAGFASMAGSLRLDGGLGALTEGLRRALPPDTVLLNRRATGFRLAGEGVEVQLEGAPPQRAKVVVLALPPRLASALNYEPPLLGTGAMHAIPTWMAGQAKVLAFYPRPFWREAGLSGDAASQRGPLAEIHDASPRSGGPYALFGFVGRADREPDRLLEDARQQLVRMFGPDAADPSEMRLADWAREGFTSSPADRAPLRAHPQYGLPPSLRDLWEGRLVLASSECSEAFGGYLEGALVAAEHAEARVRARLA